MRSFLIVIFIINTFLNSRAQEISLMSYNIRYDNPDDGINNWEFRKEALCDQIKSFEADFIGVQEALWSQMQYLNNKLESYDFIGVGRDDGKKSGEFSAIFYKNSAFENLFANTIWLSEHPEIIKAGWDAALPRICTYGLFKHKVTGDSIWILNTHLDHIGEKSRANSAIQLLDLINGLSEFNDIPVFLMGDFNALPADKPILLLSDVLKDAFNAVDLTQMNGIGTFNGFGNELEQKRIDYIFCKACNFNDFILSIDTKENGLYISDHFPVFAKAIY